MNHTIQTEKQKLNVELFGQKYTFRAEADERQKLLDIAGHVDYMMHKIGDNQPKLDYRDVAVLAAMNIAEEYYQDIKAQVNLFNVPTSPTVQFSIESIEKIDEELRLVNMAPNLQCRLPEERLTTVQKIKRKVDQSSRIFSLFE